MKSQPTKGGNVETRRSKKKTQYWLVQPEFEHVVPIILKSLDAWWGFLPTYYIGR